MHIKQFLIHGLPSNQDNPHWSIRLLTEHRKKRDWELSCAIPLYATFWCHSQETCIHINSYSWIQKVSADPLDHVENNCYNLRYLNKKTLLNRCICDT